MEDQKFSAYIYEEFFQMIFEQHFNLVYRAKDLYVAPKTLNNALKFISNAVYIDNAFDKIKPFLQKILYEAAAPIMKISQEDMFIFSDDVVEYLRRQHSYSEALYSTKMLMLDLITDICQYKSEKSRVANYENQALPEFLLPFLQYASTAMG